MMKSMLELPKLVQHLVDYVEVYGIEVGIKLDTKAECTDLRYCQHYYTHVKLGQFTNNMPKD